MAYHEWLPQRASTDAGNGAAAEVPANAAPNGRYAVGRTVICAHGLTRNGRDFDRLAERLAQDGFRVICPDFAGRGLSDHLPVGYGYAVPQYVADSVTLIARLDVERVDWVGTSMGGLIGLLLASLEQTPVARLLLNDIGPEIDARGLERIRGYVGDKRTHASFDRAEQALRESMKSFGPHDDAEFRLLSRHSFVEGADGLWRAHYDPAIAEPILADDAGGAGATDRLWAAWDAVCCPVAVLRGSESDVLSAATFEAMEKRGPVTMRETIDGVGHAPTLLAANQIDIVRRFLGTSE